MPLKKGKSRKAQAIGGIGEEMTNKPALEPNQPMNPVEWDLSIIDAQNLINDPPDKAKDTSHKESAIWNYTIGFIVGAAVAWIIKAAI
jgi:hypothetical protein